MSIECSECEWDARAGHDPDCSRSTEAKLKATEAEIETWHQIWNDVEMLAARVEALRDGTAQTC